MRKFLRHRVNAYQNLSTPRKVLGWLIIIPSALLSLAVVGVNIFYFCKSRGTAVRYDWPKVLAQTEIRQQARQAQKGESRGPKVSDLWETKGQPERLAFRSDILAMAAFEKASHPELLTKKAESQRFERAWPRLQQALEHGGPICSARRGFELVAKSDSIPVMSSLASSCRSASEFYFASGQGDQALSILTVLADSAANPSLAQGSDEFLLRMCLFHSSVTALRTNLPHLSSGSPAQLEKLLTALRRYEVRDEDLLANYDESMAESAQTASLIGELLLTIEVTNWHVKRLLAPQYFDWWTRHTIEVLMEHRAGLSVSNFTHRNHVFQKQSQGALVSRLWPNPYTDKIAGPIPTAGLLSRPATDSA